MSLKLEARQGVVFAHRSVGDGLTLNFIVENLRQAPTGVHGRLSILLNDSKLAWDTFNLEKNTDRTSLANTAFRVAAGQLAKSYTADFLKLDLADFCEHCWDTFICQHLAQDVPGDIALAAPVRLLDPYIIQGSGTIMFGPPKVGKSYVQLAQALSIHYGVQKLWPVQKANVMLVNLERSGDSLRGRLAQVALSLGLPPETTLPILTRRGWPLAALEQSIAKGIEQRGTEVLFVDSLSRGGFGDMIAADKINPGMDMLNRLVPTWHALAHSPRSDSGHVYGGIFWDAAADVLVRQHAQVSGETLGIALAVTASNHTGKPPQELIALTFNADMLVEIRRAKPNEFGELEAEARGGMLAQIIDFLQESGNSTATIMAKELGFSRQQIATALKDDKVFTRIGPKSMKGQMYGLRSEFRDN